MADQNLFEQLKGVLEDFKQFLDENVPTIKPAIQAIASLIPKVTELLDLLIGLLGKLKTEVEKLEVGGIPGLAEVTEFTQKIPAFLEAAREFLPGEAASIDAIADVTGLLNVDAIKDEIIKLLDDIVRHLTDLKP